MVCPVPVEVDEVTLTLWIVWTPKLASRLCASAPMAGRRRGSKRSLPESIVVEAFGKKVPISPGEVNDEIDQVAFPGTHLLSPLQQGHPQR